MRVIVSASELAFQPTRTPYLRLIGTSKSAGPASAAAGAEVTLSGEGFVPNSSKQNPLRLLLGSPTFVNRLTTVTTDIAVDEQGKFSVKFKAPGILGPYEVIVEQQEGKRLTMTKTKLLVVPTDTAR